MVLVNPFLYLEEMQDRQMTDLNLLPNEVPSVPVICRTLHELNLSKHKSTKVLQERFTPVGHWSVWIYLLLVSPNESSNANPAFLLAALLRDY